jgi:hypothetical protein
MATHEVSREDWPSFFEELSIKRQGCSVTIVEVDPKTGPSSVVTKLPFVGMSYEEKGSEAGAIEVMAGTEPEDHITHVIQDPQQVIHKTGRGLLSSELNPSDIVEITKVDGPPITYVQFSS